MAHINDSVWACDNRYYINGKPVAITSAFYKKITPEEIRAKLEQFREQNGYAQFNFLTDRFITVNKDRLSAVTDEAHGFIAKASKGYKKKEIVISFSGGKDSTVTADLVTRALQDPSVVHIFGDTTLEFPLTIEYACLLYTSRCV